MSELEGFHTSKEVLKPGLEEVFLSQELCFHTSKEVLKQDCPVRLFKARSLFPYL